MPRNGRRQCVDITPMRRPLLLNSGPVTVGPAFRDQSARTVRKVEVKGSDLAVKMIGRDLAHQAGSGLSWC